MKKKINIITPEKIKKYRELTSEALALAKKSISKGKEKESKEIITMVTCYLSDSIHFENNNNLVDSYGALNYAHGWLDSGARLKIFNVTDNRLFTV
jgi:hypothetical protein